MESKPCGPDLDAIVEAVKPFWEAGSTDMALVQVGDELQDRFLAEATEPLLERLRAAAPPPRIRDRPAWLSRRPPPGPLPARTCSARQS